MNTQMVDREPNRSVQLIRRIDTRVPANLLSQARSAGSTLGKLADLRAPARAPPLGPASSGPPRVGKGWNSVVAPARVGTPPPAAASVNNGPSALADSIRSGHVSRSSTPASPRSSGQLVAATPAAPSSEEVPDNWEDDA